MGKGYAHSRVREITMTTYLNDSFFYLVLALNVSIICLFVLSRLRRLQSEVLTLRAEIYSERERMAKNLNGLHYRLQSAEEKLESAWAVQGELKANKSMDSSLSQANKLLDMGLDSDQLIKGFGLSEAEANLMSLIHARQHQYKAAA
jgi:hypothetical protein